MSEASTDLLVEYKQGNAPVVIQLKTDQTLRLISI